MEGGTRVRSFFFFFNLFLFVYRTCVPAAVAGAELASSTRAAIVNGSGADAKLAKKRYLPATTFMRYAMSTPS